MVAQADQRRASRRRPGGRSPPRPAVQRPGAPAARLELEHLRLQAHPRLFGVPCGSKRLAKSATSNPPDEAALRDCTAACARSSSHGRRELGGIDVHHRFGRRRAPELVRQAEQAAAGEAEHAARARERALQGRWRRVSAWKESRAACEPVERAVAALRLRVFLRQYASAPRPPDAFHGPRLVGILHRRSAPVADAPDDQPSSANQSLRLSADRGRRACAPGKRGRAHEPFGELRIEGDRPRATARQHEQLAVPVERERAPPIGRSRERVDPPCKPCPARPGTPRRSRDRRRAQPAAVDQAARAALSGAGRAGTSGGLP